MQLAYTYESFINYNYFFQDINKYGGIEEGEAQEI